MVLLALDANSIINRAFYGIRPLSTKEGIPTNAIYGFMNILNKLIETVKPDVIAAAFDLKAPTFRHQMYDAYKAGRRPMPDELAQQIPIMKDVLKAFGCIVYEKEGFEADDILGTLAAKCDDNGEQCFIATGDRDSLQLVSDNVHVLLAATKAGRPEITEYDPDKIMEKYGVTPHEMIEIKALQGDSSDNIPGVAGVGEKTAGTLISKYHSIDYIYDNIARLDERDTLKNKLLGGKESAFMSRKLGTICRDVPIELDFGSVYLKMRDGNELVRLLVKLEMNKLLEKMNVSAQNITMPAEKTAVEKKAENIKIEFNGIAEIPENSVICIDENSEKIFAKCSDK